MSKPIIELTVRGSDKVVAHACGKCRHVGYDERHARECCEAHVCQCGATCSRSWTSCDDCRNKKHAKKERDRFEAAEKVSWRDYNGPVYWEGPGGDYWHSAEEFAETFAGELPPEDFPPYVWACERFALQLNAVDIVEQQLERQEHYEDAGKWIVGMEDLQDAMDAWLAKQSIESWRVNDRIAVLLDGLEVDDD